MSVSEVGSPLLLLFFSWQGECEILAIDLQIDAMNDF